VRKSPPPETWEAGREHRADCRADGGLELPLKVVQVRLGHGSIQMTADRYGHLFPRRTIRQSRR
jgi:integrase